MGYPSRMEKKAKIPWEVIEWKLASMGKIQSWLAQQLNTGTNTVSNWKTRGGAPLDQAPKIAKALKCTVDELLPKEVGNKHISAPADKPIKGHKSPVTSQLSGKSEPSISEPLQSNVSGKLQLRAGRAVAVVGEVQGGPDGFISVDDYPMGHGYAELPEVRSRDIGAYGLKVRGDSMRPRIKAGEYIVVEPNSEAQPGDDVVVKFLDGSAVVKELLWIREGDVCLGSINNGVAPITRPLAEIEYIHRVAAIMPRGSAIEVEN
jgi:phage repressor protein C with HTH and peptisase S24 domain